MRNNIALMLLLLLLSLSFSLYCRPYDWQYSRLSVPFAVFYNPALIGNNPGYTFGIDGRYIDDDDYDIRGAIVIPISKVMRYEEQLQNRGRSKSFRYSNTSYRSSRTALSLGGIYEDEENYQLSAGFVTPIDIISTGASVDLVYSDGIPIPVASFNLALSTDVPRIMRGGVLRLAFHNVAVSKRDSTNNFSFSIGTGGVPFSDPRMYYLPYDLLFRFHIKDGVDRVEGIARVNFDLSYIHTSSQTKGQTVAGAVGYNFIRMRNGRLDHKFFGTLGVTFIGRTSSTAVLGSYGEGEEKYGTIFYNTFKRNALAGTIADASGKDGAFAVLDLRESDGNKKLFGLKTGGPPIDSWVLRIDNEKGENVTTFSGGNVVPSSILWDGLTSQGIEVKNDVVYAKLVIRVKDRVVESNAVGIEFKP